MKLKSFLTTFIAIFSLSVFSQEFAVKYDMNMTSSNPETQAQLSIMGGSTMSIFSKGNLSRVENSMGGGLISTTIITDLNKNKGVMLMDGMLGKLASLFDTDSDELTEEENDNDFEFIKTEETKNILGHTCKKVILDLEDEGEIVYWITEDIKPVDGTMGKYVQKGLPGLPLEFNIETSDLTISFTATELETKVKKSKDLFDIKIPKGYTETELDSIMKMGGGM